MLTFLSVAFSIYGAMHAYALSKVWLAFPHSTWLALALLLAGIVMTLSPLMLWYITRQNWHAATVAISWVAYLWMGFLFLFCCIALLLDLGHGLATVSGFHWHPGAAMGLFTAGLLALGLMGYGFISAKQIQLEKITITTPKLSPAIGKVTIAQISDLHLGIMLGDDFLDRVIARLREIQPDIIVATGDVVDGQGDDLIKLAKRFLALHPPKGAYAVTGNHEFFAGLENSLQFLRNAGFTVLRGESVATGGITLVGVDDPAALSTRQGIAANTSQVPVSPAADNFIVLLKHQPLVDTKIAFDLQLSGHVHGGQIFPFGILTRLKYGVSSGLTHLAGGRWLYVSRGTGTWEPPVRLFAPPEITLITVKSEIKQ